MMKKIIFLVIVLMILTNCAKPSGVENALSIEAHIQTSGYAVDFSLTDDYIFIAEDQRGFSIYNRENHEQISQVDSLDMDWSVTHFENVKKIDANQDGEILFVYDRYGSPASINIYDISQPDSAQFIFQIAANTGNVQKTMTSLQNEDETLLIWTNSASINVGYYGYNEEYETTMWNPLNSLDLPNAVKGFDAIDTCVVIAAEQSGIYIVHSEANEITSSLDLPGEATDVNIVDNYAFVTIRQEGFAIVDISDIYNPQLIHIQEVNELIYTIDIEDNYLVVSSHSGGVLLYDITEVMSPQLIGQIDEIGYTYKVEIEDGKIYAATRSGIYKIKIN